MNAIFCEVNIYPSLKKQWFVSGRHARWFFWR